MSPSLQERIAVCRRRYDAAPQSRAFAPLADLLRQAGEHTEALTLLEEGLERHPGFHGAMVILGHTLLGAGRDDHARLVLQRVLDHDADNRIALRLLAEDARSRRDWAGAVPMLERLAELEPDDGRWPEALGEARDHRDRPDESATSDASFATLTLVDIYLAQGYRAKARTALVKMLEREPEREDLRERLSRMGPTDTDGTEREATPESWPPGERRRRLAARRADEKRSFAEWVDRLHGDENGAAP